ncbi:hypothetical protein WJX74_006621 [Apatococcus lobatus]|uniref:Glycoside hydrolase family 5 domain-containing protein n=1 Tax=Apatococcus lobatus TaxID=904363 RepID=A0AAW1RSN0_9CHLO
MLLLASAFTSALAADRSRTALPKAASKASPPQCIVSTNLGPPWQPPGSFTYIQQITLNITNAGPSIVPVPYSLAVGNPGYTGAAQAFQWIIQSEAGGIISGAVVNYPQVLQAAQKNVVSVGFLVSLLPGHSAAPVGVRVNGVPCFLAGVQNLTIANQPAQAEESNLNPLSTDSGKIIGNDGNELRLHGVNYFGFDDANTMFDGLWGGSDSLAQDWATIVYRIQLLGFNAVRIPFSFKDLQASPKSFSQSCTQVSNSAVVSSVTNPYQGTASGVTAPNPFYQPPQQSGVCNTYLPTDSTFNRLVYVTKSLTNAGIYVLLDNQFNLDNTALEGTDNWVQSWVKLVSAFNDDAVASAKIMCDMLNEPDFGNLRWEASNGLPGVGDLYLTAMDALYAANPGLLFFVEGAGQQGSIAKNWGDGLTTDKQIIADTGISDPNTFFTTLVGKPYISQVVIAPHIYGPSVSNDKSGSSAGAALYARLSTSFGYLNKAGYNGHIFPVVLGETGTDFTQYPGDTRTLLDLASYVSLSNGADDGKHNAITSAFWWAWNANSGQGMGLVGQDWTTIDWTKIAYLQGPIMNLKPWYQGNQPAPQGPQAPADTSAAAASAEEATGAAPPPTIKNGRIFDANGNPLAFNGVVWGGFDNKVTMLDGLFLGNTSLTLDFATSVRRLAALGFNAVRIPFSFTDLQAKGTRNFTRACHSVSEAELRASLTPPTPLVSYAAQVPPLGFPAEEVPGICNGYLPADSTLSRLIFVVDFLTNNGFYVVLSNNLETDKSVLRSPETWVQNWASTFSAITVNSPSSLSNTIIEPFNDPAAIGLQWNAAGGLPGLTDLYIALQDAISTISPTTLFMLQGTGKLRQNMAGTQNFQTDPFTIAAYGLSNPTTFFRTLSGRPYVNRTILAPRIEPPSITRTSANSTGSTLWSMLDTSFGTLSQSGFTYNGVSRVFPIVIGEFGSNLTSAADITMMSDLFFYMLNAGNADTGNHANLMSWFWGTWPPNKPIVGGILLPNPYEINWAKINYLAELGLTPWYTDLDRSRASLPLR